MTVQFSPGVFCSGCNKEIQNDQILRCKQCCLAVFHDVDCQRKAWKNHKPHCEAASELHQKNVSQAMEKYFPEKNKQLPSIEVSTKMTSPMLQRLDYGGKAVEEILTHSPDLTPLCIIFMRTLGFVNTKANKCNIAKTLFLLGKDQEANKFMEQHSLDQESLYCLVVQQFCLNKEFEGGKQFLMNNKKMTEVEARQQLVAECVYVVENQQFIVNNKNGKQASGGGPKEEEDLAERLEPLHSYLSSLPPLNTILKVGLSNGGEVCIKL